jgi:outer membrane protein OmpA-like peptidoglycan-associated protein
MRTILSRLLPVLFILLAQAAGHAQVTTDDKALQALQPKPPAKGTTAPAKPPETAKPAVRRTSRPAARKTPVHPAGAAKLPAVPLAPPVNPVILPPPAVLPQHPRPVPPPVPVKADAVGTVSPLGSGGSRFTFGPDSADLNNTTFDALVQIAAAAKQDPQLDITVTAWAPGTQEDPSTPRRLSLDRALAARAVLIHEGVESDRIHAVAKGFVDINLGPPDRMDIVAAHPHPTPAGTPAPQPAPTPVKAPASSAPPAAKPRPATNPP